MIGKKFRRWTVLSFLGRKGHESYFECKCDCGTIKNVSRYSLLYTSNSCGCFNKEQVSKRMYKHGQSYHVNKKAGREYITWQRIKAVCLNSKHEHYKYYGGRGITVCERWKNSFIDFFSDLGECPKNHTVERVNVNGNYEPSNCIWLPKEKQIRNRRITKWITYNDKTMVLLDWAIELKVSYGAILAMLKHKSFEDTFKYYKNKH